MSDAIVLAGFILCVVMIEVAPNAADEVVCPEGFTVENVIHNGMIYEWECSNGTE